MLLCVCDYVLRGIHASGARNRRSQNQIRWRSLITNSNLYRTNINLFIGSVFAYRHDWKRANSRWNHIGVWRGAARPYICSCADYMDRRAHTPGRLKFHVAGENKEKNKLIFSTSAVFHFHFDYTVSLEISCGQRDFFVAIWSTCTIRIPNTSDRAEVLC